MNVERILQLADVIEKVPHVRQEQITGRNETLSAFNMGYWHCGTAGCIAGWAAEIFPDVDGDAPRYIATRALGLKEWEADNLFCPDFDDDDYITPRSAATVLRHLAATGIVDWSVATPVDGGVK